MTNLEMIIEMKKRVDEINVEVMAGMEIQKEEISKCREEKAIKLYYYFEGLRKAIGADADWECKYQGYVTLKPNVYILRLDRKGISITENMDQMLHWGNNYQLTARGVTRKEVYKFVDAFRDEHKQMVEDQIAESVRIKLQNKINNMIAVQRETNCISEAYGLETN